MQHDDLQDIPSFRLDLMDADRHRMVRAASRLLGPADAEDAVQDAYVRALEADVPALNAAQAWLLTVVRNLAIDRLRRRNWMQQWLQEEADVGDAAPSAPSAETHAVLAQEAEGALRLLAAQLAPEDGAALLLHEVFGFGHGEIAAASGRSEAASRQQLRRALLRLRQVGDTSASIAEPERGEETVFRLYVQSMQLRDPQTLWAMLRQPPISALRTVSAIAGMHAQVGASSPAPQALAGGVVQVGGQLGLVLTLDGVRLCVLPLGVRSDSDIHQMEA